MKLRIDHAQRLFNAEPLKAAELKLFLLRLGEERSKKDTKPTAQDATSHSKRYATNYEFMMELPETMGALCRADSILFPDINPNLLNPGERSPARLRSMFGSVFKKLEKARIPDAVDGWVEYTDDTSLTVRDLKLFAKKYGYASVDARVPRSVTPASSFSMGCIATLLNDPASIPTTVEELSAMRSKFEATGKPDIGELFDTAFAEFTKARGRDGIA